MDKVDKTALKGSLAVTGATTATLTGITAGLTGPAANLGGYATAQIVAGGLGGTFAGPGLATAIAAVGGPIVAGGIVIAGTSALVFYGIRFFGRRFGRRYRW